MLGMRSASLVSEQAKTLTPIVQLAWSRCTVQSPGALNKLAASFLSLLGLSRWRGSSPSPPPRSTRTCCTPKISLNIQSKVRIKEKIES